MKARTWLAGALVALSISVWAADVTSWQGKQLPPIKMKTIAGKALDNGSLKGKVAIFDFWATWCGPCKAASPVMQKMHEKYGKRGLVVIGANVWEQPTTKNPAGNYAKEHKYTYTFTEKNDALAKTLGITGIPTMLIVDKKGKIAKVLVGYDGSLESQLDKTVSRLLK